MFIFWGENLCWVTIHFHFHHRKIYSKSSLKMFSEVGSWVKDYFQSDSKRRWNDLSRHRVDLGFSLTLFSTFFFSSSRQVHFNFQRHSIHKNTLHFTFFFFPQHRHHLTKKSKKNHTNYIWPTKFFAVGVFFSTVQLLIQLPKCEKKEKKFNFCFLLKR